MTTATKEPTYAGQLDIDFIRREMDTFTQPDDTTRQQFEAWLRQALPG